MRYRTEWHFSFSGSLLGEPPTPSFTVQKLINNSITLFEVINAICTKQDIDIVQKIFEKASGPPNGHLHI